MTAHSLQKRLFHLDDRAPLSARGIWFEDSPLATQLLNAYTLLIPEGERFVIRSCRREMHKVEPALQEELRLLFFQEGSHSREHGRLLGAMSAEGLALVRVRKVVDWISYGVLERMTPSILRVATAAAIEHHNAVIATHFLNQDLLKSVRPGETRRLLLWHFAEVQALASER